MSALDDLPTEVELRHTTRRAAWCAAAAVLVSVVVGAAYLTSADDLDPAGLFLVLFMVWTVATIATTTRLSRRLGALGKKEVLVAGTRRRRRRLRIALVLGRASHLDADDRRICRDLARVVQARRRVRLATDSLQLVATAAIGAALFAMGVSPRWLLWLLLATLGASVLWIAAAAWELRAASRFEAETTT